MSGDDDPRGRFLGLEGSSILEVAVTIVLGLILFVVKAEDLAEITWVVGGFLVLNRAILRKDMHADVQRHRKYVDTRLAQYQGLAEIVDINNGLRQTELRDLNDLYFRITEPEFDRVRHRVIDEASSALSLMANQKRTMSLVTGEYYNWLLPMIANSISGSEIWAVSMLLDCEFDDSPEEREWLALHLSAIGRGVIVRRVFVIPDRPAEAVASIPAVAAQIQAAGEENIRFVQRERLRRLDPELLGRLGDGLIAFDRRVVLIDEHSAYGTARGYVSMLPEEVRRRRADFDNLIRLSSPLSAARPGNLAILSTAGGEHADRQTRRRSRHA